MRVPFFKEMRIGAYILKQKLLGRKRYPLVLMLEPLFRCNLACFGCGKIDYPDPILNRRLTVKECLDAADECGAHRDGFRQSLSRAALFVHRAVLMSPSGSSPHPARRLVAP